MTSLIEPAPTDSTAPLAEALDEVRRSAQSLLADLGHRPRALRIRAGDVVVEMEWTAQEAAPAAPAPATTTVAAPVETPASDEPALPPGVGVCAPIVGTFYRAPEPGATPFVAEGDQVRRGQQVGIVEAMKLMIPVESDADGRIVALHVADGAAVEFGERLLTIDPQAG
ncbi:acetyl-CoA carboxylase biotin carboxyl carrier protein [Asanoa hainanensis]|uniref:Biotin carboxyl carrier protein of acetyl-CoA carboxylase n=1 Tax=Asanoa hainanensis TaxID=560556 RepID=A0A239NIM9_9ACTN|nr:acetyl-CoA carboxylase biotin carboxyl carrier protein subunit [Asanoa hainanensis]SNT54725.1 acetyl-CoA carboxylase biotin carboxyl carrier protein [Asanoa hainanensis]